MLQRPLEPAHHFRTVLACQKPAITVPQARQLCEAVVEAQREEIAQLEEILGED